MPGVRARCPEVDLLLAVRRDADEPVAHDAHDPGAAVLVERQAVRESAGAEFGHGLARSEPAIGVQREARQAATEGFVDIQPLTTGMQRHFVV